MQEILMRRTPASAVLAAVLLLITAPALLAQEKPAAAREERAQLLQTVGLLASSQVYQAYLNIGFMADGRANGSYDDKDLQQIMASVMNLLSATDKMLDKVGKLDLDKPDKEAIEQLRKLSALVRQQGEELQAYWKTGDKDRGARYDKLRQEAWDGISKLLGLDKEPEK
jgi:hypothetical protein